MPNKLSHEKCFNSPFPFPIILFNLFSHSGHCKGQPSKISISFGKKGIIKKISCEHRAYESVDDKTLSYRLNLKNQRKTELLQQRLKAIM